MALDFGPPEYAALALLGVLLVATIGSGNKLKAMIAGLLGLLLATVGRDTFSGASRFTFDSLQLADGIDFVVVAMGLFGVGEILYNLEQRHGKTHVPAEVGNVWPSRKELKQSSGAIGRGSVIGFVLGVLPGGGAVLSSIVAYATEKRRSKTPERFGRGAIEGVAAPETANNAAATSSFIPLLTIGLPANATMAMLFGALLILGVSPGPQLVTEHPDVFWGVINSMYIGNILLLILSIPLVGLFVRILRVRPAILAPITALITILGVYTINNSTFDIFLMVAFGVVGYLMKKAGFDPGPMVLAFVLGSIIESSTRRSLLIFGGDPTGFITRPISGTILAIFLALVLLPVIRHFVKVRRASRAQPESWMPQTNSASDAQRSAIEPPAGVAQVHPHRGPGGVGIAGDDRGRDVVVLAPHPLDVAGVGQRVRVAEPGAGQHDHHRAQRVEQFEVEPVAADRRDGAVEAEVRLDGVLRRGGDERLQCCTNGRLAVGVHPGRRQCGCLAFDSDPEVDHVEHVVVGADGGGLDGERRRLGYGEDERAAALEGFDEALGAQPGDRLADHRPRHRELVDELGLGWQLVAGRQVAGEDLVLQAGDDPLRRTVSSSRAHHHGLPKRRRLHRPGPHRVAEREPEPCALRQPHAAVANVDALVEEWVQPLEVLDPRLGRIRRGQMQMDLHRVVRCERQIRRGRPAWRSAGTV